MQHQLSLKEISNSQSSYFLNQKNSGEDTGVFICFINYQSI